MSTPTPEPAAKAEAAKYGPAVAGGLSMEAIVKMLLTYGRIAKKNEHGVVPVDYVLLYSAASALSPSQPAPEPTGGEAALVDAVIAATIEIDSWDLVHTPTPAYWGDEDWASFKRDVMAMSIALASLKKSSPDLITRILSGDSSPAAPSAPEKGEDWIPVGERLPPNSHDVLVWAEPGFALVGWYSAPRSRWRSDDSSYDAPTVTHWQPLPAPPSLAPQSPAASKGNEVGNV